jgi:CubicO group peptidase (beta-lactamase class C family)
VDTPGLRPTLEDFLARELVQVRRPGSVAVYDTYGITLAGHLIERVSGYSYGDFMLGEVFRPLGMSDTWVETPVTERARLATGYGLEDGALVPQPYEWYVTTPASSIDATAADMGKLLLALLGGGANAHGRLLSAGLMERVLSESQTPYESDVAAFSWGFWEEERDGYRALHHGGIMRGYSSELYLVPALKVGFYIVYNRDPETGSPPMLRERLVDLLYARILPRRDVAGARSPAAPVPVPTADFAGAYGNTLGCFTCPEGEGWGINTIRFTAPGPGVVAMGDRRWLAVDSTGLRDEASGALLRFLRDSAGRVRYVVRGTNSFAKLDEHLLADVLGADWRARLPASLVAITHRANERWREAAAAYASLAERAPANGAYPFYQGFSLLNAGRFADAKAAFDEALRRRKWVAWSQYYVASAHAGLRDTTAAVTALRRAVEMGFSDANLLMTESWWEPFRELPAWRAIANELRR